jgi:hypothetical protein
MWRAAEMKDLPMAGEAVAKKSATPAAKKKKKSSAAVKVVVGRGKKTPTWRAAPIRRRPSAEKAKPIKSAKSAGAS